MLVISIALAASGSARAATTSYLADRQHTTYQNASDTGWPSQGALHMHLDQPSAGLLGPEQDFASSQVPTLYLRAALHNTTQTTAEVFWNGPGQTFSQARHVYFPVVCGGCECPFALVARARPLMPVYSVLITLMRI